MMFSVCLDEVLSFYTLISRSPTYWLVMEERTEHGRGGTIPLLNLPQILLKVLQISKITCMIPAGCTVQAIQ